jgi:colanic acid biosynthesis glycosyl transferase WcaI
MKILLLTQWFEPEPTFKGLVFARALAERGHQVQVLTGFPNYPEGRVYPGYKLRPFVREDMEGIPVVRVALYPSHDRSGLRRALNYMSFALSASLLGPLLVGKADVAYVYHPPATVALPAMVLRVLRGIPFVYDVQDLWPDTLSATGMIGNGTLLKVIGLWCRAVYALARRVVVLSPGFARRLQERGVPGAKLAVVYNWCDERNVIAEPAEPTVGPPEAGRALEVVFAGNMGPAQALGSVLEAAELLQARAARIRLTLIGGGTEVEALSNEARSRGLGNVRFLPRVPMSKIGETLAHADALLVHVADEPLFDVTIPSKVQAYLASGRPILAALRGDGADLVNRAGAGMTCAPCEPEELARVAALLAERPKSVREAMGASGREFYRRHLSLGAGVRQFEEIFRAAARTRA